MNYFGIDYGEKRIGLAKSAGGTDRAIARGQVENDDTALENIAEMCEKEDIDVVVLGDSKNFAGEDNAIMTHIRSFQTALKTRVSAAVKLAPEFFTTAQARRQPESPRDVDGSAAALILQTFLDQK